MLMLTYTERITTEAIKAATAWRALPLWKRVLIGFLAGEWMAASHRVTDLVLDATNPRRRFPW